jgi:hypothetical protein
MFTNKSTQARDHERVDLSDDREVRYWSQALGASEEDLRTAVEFAGSSPEAVRDYLSRQRLHT